jgi:hypothetical protein
VRRLGALGAAMALALMACSSGDGGGHRTESTATTRASARPNGISEARAIEIALDAWKQEDPTFDGTSVRPEADPIAETYDVALVPKVITGPGGEPHVVVDRATGKVVRTYRTK